MIQTIDYSKLKIKHLCPAAELVLGSLKNITQGQIQIILPNAEVLVFTGKNPGVSAHMRINSFDTFDFIMERSDIGLGETYMRGFWSSNNVSNLIEFAIMNKKALEKAMIGQWRKIILYKIKHLFNFNSKAGSRKNIQAHYDLGNSFYKLWLDESMTYSSAFWSKNKELSLFEAQQNKYEHMLSQLGAKLGEHILEIGCGWGGFAMYAAQKGMRVTGITISKEQYDFAVSRIKSSGLENLVEIKFIDYRDIKGQFDHVISIEMLEAVGESFWQGYFRKIKEVVRPGGSVVIQSITIHDDEFNRYRRGTDFIQQYIFPGGMLPCERVLQKIIKKLDGHSLNFTRFGLDYSRTLRHWLDNFNSQNEMISKLGYTDEFQRMWCFYLEYCEGAFRAGQTNVITLAYKV